MATTEESSGKWYPGKLMSKAIRRSSVQESPGSTGSPPLTGSNSSTRVKSETTLRRRSVAPSTYTSSSLTSGPIPVARATSVRSIPTTRNPIGNLRLQIFGLKYSTATNPSIQVEVEGDAREYSDLNQFFEENFSFTDICSDITISLLENYTMGAPEVIGQIVLPMSAYVGMSKPLPVLREFRMFFPFRSSKSWDVLGLYQAGFEGVPGTAMTKPREPLGFIDMQLEVSLVEAKMHSFYLLPTASRESAAGDRFIDQDDVFLEHCYNRDKKRLARLMQPPSFIAQFVRIPEIIIPLVLFGFVCFSCPTFYLPIFTFLLLLFNGVLTKFSRNFSHVTVWNSGFAPPPYLAPVSSSSASAVPGSTQVASALLSASDRTLFKDGSDAGSPVEEFVPIRSIAKESYKYLNVVVTVGEKLVNLFSFADACMSLFMYQVLAVTAFFLSFIIAIFSFGGLLFFCTAIGAAAFMFQDFLCTFIQESTVEASTVDTTSSVNEPAAFVKARVVIRALNNFWSRIPTEIDLVHRHIAALTYVKEDGPDMSDAAEARKKA